MDLVGAWLRQLLRAGTAAAIVPVALIAALLVIALGSGGLGGLDSLGQLVAGPPVSESDREAGPSATDDLRTARVAPGDRDVVAARPTVRSAPSASGRAPTRAPGRPAPQQGSGSQIAPAPGSSSVTRPTTPVTPPAPVAPPPPPPVGQPRPPQLGEVLGATVNGVVVGVQTLLEQLVQGLGLKPPPAP